MKETLYTIYYHRNKINNKYYIGQTKQTLINRFGRNGKRYMSRHEHIKFNNAIKKYGWDSFEHGVICTCHTIEEANKLEEYYIQKYDSFLNGYNATKGGGGKLGLSGKKCAWYGRKHTEEEKKKISKANKGKVVSRKNSKSKCILAVDKETNCIVGEYVSINQCSDVLKINQGDISRCLSGKRKYAKGYYFIEKDKYDGLAVPPTEHISHNSKQVRCINTGEIFRSMMEAGRKYNISSSDISRCVNGKRKTCGELSTGERLKWEYADNE